MLSIWSLEDEEMRDFWRNSGVESKRKLLIAYCDRNGVVTKREISALYYNEVAGILAYCHLRKELRTFMFERITACSDTETGEVVQADAVFDYLYSFYQKTSDYSVDVFFSDHQELVRLLAYFLWIKVLPHKVPDKIIHKICLKVTGDNRITEAQAGYAFCLYDESSERAFKQRVGKLRNNHPLKYRVQIMKIFLSVAKYIKPLEPEQLSAVKYMADRLFSKEEKAAHKRP